MRIEEIIDCLEDLIEEDEESIFVHDISILKAAKNYIEDRESMGLIKMREMLMEYFELVDCSGCGYYNKKRCVSHNNECFTSMKESARKIAEEIMNIIENN